MTQHVEQHSPQQPINEMSDREIAEETLYWLREAGRALQELQNGGMASMMKTMMSSSQR